MWCVDPPGPSTCAVGSGHPRRPALSSCSLPLPSALSGSPRVAPPCFQFHAASTLPLNCVQVAQPLLLAWVYLAVGTLAPPHSRTHGRPVCRQRPPPWASALYSRHARIRAPARGLAHKAAARAFETIADRRLHPRTCMNAERGRRAARSAPSIRRSSVRPKRSVMHPGTREPRERGGSTALPMLFGEAADQPFASLTWGRRRAQSQRVRASARACHSP